MHERDEKDAMLHEVACVIERDKCNGNNSRAYSYNNSSTYHVGNEEA